MPTLHLKPLIACWTLLLLFILAACTTQGNTNTTTGNANTSVSTPTHPQRPLQPTATATSNASSHSVPIVILTPTPFPGGNSYSQMVTLPDRTIIINSISKQPGANTSSTAIVLVITIKNTSAKTIMNQSSFFQLIGAEGDIFGLQSNTATNFFGTIASASSRNGTITFQLPTAAINGLRLLYRSEIASETVFVPLNV